MPKPAFPLGHVVATPAAIEFTNTHPVDLAVLIARHQSGDCGDMSDDDILANLSAIVSGGKIFSSYQIGPQKIWIITEADRRLTTIKLPADY
jgi:hypothetical protein